MLLSGIYHVADSAPTVSTSCRHADPCKVHWRYMLATPFHLPDRAPPAEKNIEQVNLLARQRSKHASGLVSSLQKPINGCNLT